MEEGANAEPVVDVRVDIHADLLAEGAGRANPGQGLIHLAPVGLAGGLEVVDVDRGAGGFTDPERLVDRFEQAVAFVPHVGEVTSPEFTGHPGQFGDLRFRSIDRGRINQRGGDPDRAGLHRLADQGPHPFEFFGGGLAIGVADDDLADLGVTHGLGHVHRDARLLELGEELPHGPPAAAAALGGVKGGIALAFPRVDRGDALGDQV